MNGPLPTRPPAATPFGPPLHGGDLVRTIVIGIALLMVASLIVGEFASATGGRINVLIASFAASSFSWLAAIWLVFVKRRGLTFADLGYTIVDRRWALMGIGTAFGALPVALVLAGILRPVLGSDSSPTLQQFFGGGDLTAIHALTILLYAGFLVPLAEELVFRGLLFRWLRQRLDFWPSAFISAAVFGIAHGGADKAVISGLLGIPLALLFEKSRSLAPAILMHQTYNSLALMLTFAAMWLPPGTES
jgi:membrane protease YdiL (CAAX protease family)